MVIGKMRFDMFTSIFIHVCLYMYIEGYSTGAPYKTCIDGYAQHEHGHLAPQTSEPPYTITVDKTTYSPGDKITVSLSSPGGEMFRGFQVRAQMLTGNQEEIIGRFTDAPEDALLQYWYPAIDGQHDAPEKTYGDIVFRSGFVKNYYEFWPNVDSPVVKASSVVNPNNNVNTSFPPLSLDTKCGVTKGCLLYPSTCTGDNCRFGLAYSPTDDGQHIQFELFGEVDPDYWLSFGISKDKMMGSDSATSCYTNGNLTRVGFIQSYCPGHYCERIPIDNITDLGIRREDGMLYCRFVRPVVMTHRPYLQNPYTGEFKGEYPVTFDLNDEHHVFIAWGHLPGGLGVIGPHHQLPLVSHRKVNFRSYEVQRSQQMPTRIQIHAALGIIAWLGLVGLGMLTARHLRQDMRKPCAGSPFWFQLHRALMVMAISCSTAGIIVMFAIQKSWTKHAQTHSIFGLVAVGLSLIQTLGGLCRPGIESDYRSIFNWAHRISAITIFVAAVVCMFLGTNNHLLHPALRQRETIIIAAGLGCQLLWEIILEILTVKKDKSSHNFGERKASEMEIEVVDASGGSTDKTILYMCFITTTLVTTVLAVLSIFELF